MLPIHGVPSGSFEELLEKYRQNQEYFTIPEYNFDHVIWNLGKNASSRVISEAYLSSLEILDIAHKSIGKKYIECGINVILKTNFLMIVPTYRPYASTFGRNLYPDPLWYCGIINLPEIPKKWPETAGVINVMTPFKLLEKSSRYQYE